MNSIVCKFGGSSVASADKYQSIKNILAENPDRHIVVVSAPGKRNDNEIKVTDLLFTCHNLSVKKLPFDKIFDQIKNRYTEIENDLKLTTQIDQELLHFKQELLNQTVSIDYALSRGEYFSAKLMQSYLNAEFIDPVQNIFFDENGFLDIKSYDHLNQTLSSKTKMYVVPGFYGVSHLGTVKTFSRGGSDITGSIVASAVQAQVYENWTDVSGMLVAHPKIVENPKPIAKITYRELRELSYMGASVFHDEAIEAVKQKQIPIRIKNTQSPAAPGTLIVSNRSGSNGIVGITGKENAVIFNLEKNLLNKQKGFGRRLLGIFENHSVSYEFCPSSIDSISVVVLQEELEDKQQRICKDIKRILQPDYLSVQELSLIAVVGEGMKNTIGIAADIFTALKQAKVNVSTIDQGSSEFNIIIGVERSQYITAIQALYQNLVG